MMKVFEFTVQKTQNAQRDALQCKRVSAGHLRTLIDSHDGISSFVLALNVEETESTYEYTITVEETNDVESE